MTDNECQGFLSGSSGGAPCVSRADLARQRGVFRHSDFALHSSFFISTSISPFPFSPRVRPGAISDRWRAVFPVDREPRHRLGERPWPFRLSRIIHARRSWLCIWIPIRPFLSFVVR